MSLMLYKNDIININLATFANYLMFNNINEATDA